MGHIQEFIRNSDNMLYVNKHGLMLCGASANLSDPDYSSKEEDDYIMPIDAITVCCEECSTIKFLNTETDSLADIDFGLKIIL